MRTIVCPGCRHNVRHHALAILRSGLRAPCLLRLLSFLGRCNDGAYFDRHHQPASAGANRHALTEVKASVLISLALCCAISFLAATAHGETKPPPNDRHVVVLVWDGMRPDFVTERATPTLWKLAQEGVTFQHHHSVYISATNVNGAAIATGAYPNRTSLLANREFRPAIDERKAFENAEDPVIKKADQITGGKYIGAPTIAEIVRGAGRSTAIVGAKAVAFIHDRHADWSFSASKNFVRFAAAPMPAALRDDTLRLLGPFP